MSRPECSLCAEDAADAIRAVVPDFPKVAIVLGSGLGALADRLSDVTTIPYGEIPHFPKATVAGHKGNLLVGTLPPSGTRVAVFQGRFHYYEGHELTTTTLYVRALKRLGVSTLVLTAATGGINTGFAAGDLMILTDHLNLIGTNPLRGPNDETFGPRFPDMTQVYSARLRAIANDVAAARNITLRQGVYAALSGPSYETPAEIKMLRTLGADVVGMSTVPEAIVARYCGIEVLAFALVTNAAAGVTGDEITHEDVLAAGLRAGERLGDLIQEVISKA